MMTPEIIPLGRTGASHIKYLRFGRGCILVTIKMTTYRFWFRNEIVYSCFSTVKLADQFFIDWCWNMLEDQRYFSPNTHELFIHDGPGFTDIYIERGNG